MHTFLTKGLAETAALWSDVEQGYAWVHRAAHLLSNDDKLSAAEVRQTYETLLTEMEHLSTPSGPLTMMLSTFRKVTASYWSGLFHCYDQADLPRTNNELEQYFGSARYHERRATGRKQASPGVVIRGAGQGDEAQGGAGSGRARDCPSRVLSPMGCGPYPNE